MPTRLDKHDDQALIEADMTLLLAALTVWLAVIPVVVVIAALIYPYVLRRSMAARGPSVRPAEGHISGPDGTALHIARTRSSVASR